MSTVVDKTSVSDGISTASTASTASEHHNDLTKAADLLEAFDHLDKDFITHPDYLLKRLANSEAVTHVESRGEAGAVVEKVTAVVAPNTVLIEETLTLQPPLSFQDAPLSYAHETRPGMFYTADLAADSTTHFRPIRDDASIVESVNGDAESGETDSTAPPLPVRNHVNRIPVNQISPESVADDKTEAIDAEKIGEHSLILPPKPLPRKDSKLKRKRLPPPPPPPTAPRREVPPVPLCNLEISKAIVHEKTETSDVTILEISSLRKEQQVPSMLNEPIGVSSASPVEIGVINGSISSESTPESVNNDPTIVYQAPADEKGVTNKVLEIIEMKRVKALQSENAENLDIIQSNIINNNGFEFIEAIKVPILPSPRHKNVINTPKLSSTESSNLSSPDVWEVAQDGNDEYNSKYNESDDDDNESYESLDQIDDVKIAESVPVIITKQLDDTDSSSESSDDNGDDYYWQSNLATIGEEEETPSIEYNV